MGDAAGHAATALGSISLSLRASEPASCDVNASSITQAYARQSVRRSRSRRRALPPLPPHVSCSPGCGVECSCVPPLLGLLRRFFAPLPLHVVFVPQSSPSPFSRLTAV